MDYTGPVACCAACKQDATWLGRFNFEALRDFSGLSCILTILAWGLLFHDKDGETLPGEPREHIETACRGLCAWCSVPDQRKKDWQYQTDFVSLHEKSPELVDKTGQGWFFRHFHRAMAFAAEHPDVVRKSYADVENTLDRKFDAQWRDKIRQFQIPPFAPSTDGAWTLRFDDVLADALELGPLRQMEVELPGALMDRVDALCPKKLPAHVRHTLIAYYAANRLEDSDWVVLPVINFDCFFSDTNFGQKYLHLLPLEIIERTNSRGFVQYALYNFGVILLS